MHKLARWYKKTWVFQNGLFMGEMGIHERSKAETRAGQMRPFWVAMNLRGKAETQVVLAIPTG